MEMLIFICVMFLAMFISEYWLGKLYDSNWKFRKWFDKKTEDWLPGFDD